MNAINNVAGCAITARATAIKERPILFSAPMVRALLDGSKTQTRRLVKPHPGNGWAFETPPVLGRITSTHSKKGKFGAFIRRGLGTDFPEADLIPCPHGQPGDRLWVRETWCREFEGGFNYRADDAPGEKAEFVDANGEPLKGTRWKPSIHMPRAASRITLEITGVRVERLQDISENDAIAEGVSETGALILGNKAQDVSGPIAEYAVLWESINGPGSWDANPWVWVVEFRRLEGGAA